MTYGNEVCKACGADVPVHLGFPWGDHRSDCQLVKQWIELLIQWSARIETDDTTENQKVETIGATDEQTKDQIANVMLQHGTEVQQKEALQYIGAAMTEDPPVLPIGTQWQSCCLNYIMTSKGPVEYQGGPHAVGLLFRLYHEVCPEAKATVLRYLREAVFKGDPGEQSPAVRRCPAP